MQEIILRGKGAVKGIAEGEALVAKEPMGFWSDIDVYDGTIINQKSPSMGKSIAGKIFVFPTARGSTAEAYAVYLLKRGGSGPKALINVSANPTTVAGAVISQTPMVYKLDKNPLDVIETGDHVRVDGTTGEVIVTKKK
ncbi:MAG: DUF126 domain-containing protein [Chloroflexi bacterium]|nr:DUF126 domain-containing protein [Chloroflexota bacterium]